MAWDDDWDDRGDRWNNQPPVQTVIRDLGDGYLGVWSDYANKNRLKSIPTPRWDPDLRCWKVMARFETEVCDLVDELNGERGSGNAKKSMNYNAGGATTTTGSPGDMAMMIERLFKSLPSHLYQPTYRALAKAWHPDVGGDTEIMKSLNDVWSRVS